MSVAVVTGASRGIGLATARRLAERGLTVAMLGRDPHATAAAAAAVAAQTGARTLGLGCDVADAARVEAAARAVLDELGAPRVVVNNAGVVLRGKALHETTPEEWDHVVATNLRGPFLISRAFLPAMLERAVGRLVHVASISSTLGSPRAASYAASKWGVVGLSKSLAEEIRGKGLVSVALLPGSVDTDMLQGSGFPPAMTADDVAREIVHLALDAPEAINGSAVEMFG